MHKPIRDHLEAYLGGLSGGPSGRSSDSAMPEEFRAHLAACSSCQEQLRAVAGQSQQLRVFRDTSQPEPPAGFYARVLNRIEEQRPDSFWSVFMGPVLGGRLTYACAALLLVLGTYLVTSEPGDQNQAPDGYTYQLPPAQVADGAMRPPDRDAVLVNLASFRE